MRWTHTAGYCLLLIAAPGLAAAPVHARQAGASFNVTATLQSASSPATAAPTSGFCTKSTGSDSFGAVVTIVCATGAVADIAASGTGNAPWRPIHGGAYLFGNLAGDGSGYVLRRAPGAGETSGDESEEGRILGRIVNYTGAGTVTSWRTVNLPDWDYIEMQLGW